MSIKDRLIQFVLRGKNELSPEVKQAAQDMENLAQEAAALGAALDDAKAAQGLAQALERIGRDVQLSQRNLQQANQQVVDLREALSKTPDAAGLQQSLKDAEREASRARKQLNALEAQLAAGQKAAGAAGIDTKNLGAEQQRLAAEVSAARQAVATNNEALKQAQREHAAAARAAAEHRSRIESVRDAMDRGGRQVLTYAAAYLSLNGAVSLFRSGIRLVADGIRAVANAGSEEQQSLGQLQAALESTGRQAEFTTDQLRRMADELEDSSMRTSEEIQSAQARLLSYTDVAAKEFPRAMQVVVDQQQRLGISIEQSAEIVGRALQSPSKAMEALGRQGFTLEEGQKRLLVQLEATGKKAEAQALIMKLLAEAYGGSAAAAKMGTFAGLLKTLDKQIGDFTKRVKNAGAFEFMQRKLQGVSDYLDQMANDGRLDRLAESLSNAFIQGVEWVEKFAKSVVDVDFSKVSDDAASWLNNFGKHLDETQAKLSAFALPFRALFNGLTAGLSLAAAAITQRLSEVLGMIGLVADQLPEMLGGPKLKAAVDGARATLDALTDGFVAQVEQDGKDLRAALASAMGGITADTEQSQAEQTAIIKQAADDQFEHVVQRVTDINNALSQISAADGVVQLRQLQKELLSAFQAGRISQTEYANATGVLNQRLADLGATSTSAGSSVNKLAAELKTLADVQNAISTAKTDRDISAINTALKMLLDTGQISGAQYNAELKKSADKLKEIKSGLEGATKAQRAKTDADKEALVTNEQLRRESGKRMEEERKAIAQSVQDRRKGADAAKKDMSGLSGWVGGVMTAARAPLAAMSQAAVQLFEDLRGIGRADTGIDTSNLEATRKSLSGVAKELENVKEASNSQRLSSFGRWQLETQRASLETQTAFLGQKAALQGLMDGYEKGDMSAQQFVRSARAARQALGLLDKSDLNSLSAAIRAAEQQMVQMEKSTRSSLDSLNDELDALEGREADIERRKFQNRRNDLQAQVAEAEASGNAQAVANAQRALGLLRQVEVASEQQRQRAEQEKRVEAAKPAAESVAPAPPAKVLRLESKGKAVDVPLASADDETKLLAILADAGLRAI